jgi:hypothetical protein
MQAGLKELAKLERRLLKAVQNELLRATGWPVEEPVPPPRPTR